MGIEKRVQRGIDWLDAHGPTDWRDRLRHHVQTRGLAMRVACGCVLGGIYWQNVERNVSGFDYALKRFPDLNPVRCGFAAKSYFDGKRPFHESAELEDREYQNLSAEWLKRLEA